MASAVAFDGVCERDQFVAQNSHVAAAIGEGRQPVQMLAQQIERWDQREVRSIEKVDRYLVAEVREFIDLENDAMRYVVAASGSCEGMMSKLRQVAFCCLIRVSNKMPGRRFCEGLQASAKNLADPVLLNSWAIWIAAKARIDTRKCELHVLPAGHNSTNRAERFIVIGVPAIKMVGSIPRT